MAAIDLQEMALPLQGEKPAGDNLEYDPLYIELENLATGEPGSQMGNETTEGRDPDYRKLGKNCLELWKRTRDLRVGAYLLVSQTLTEGLNGLVPSLKLLTFLVKDLWESFYPLLDPDFNNSPVERLNILTMISPEAGSVNDPVMFLSHFRNLRLVPNLSYTIRDLMVTQGEIEDLEGKPVDGALMQAEMMNVPIETMKAQAELVANAKTAIAELCEEMNAKMQDGSSLNLTSLEKEVNRLNKYYNNHLNAYGTGDGASEGEGAEEGADQEEGAALGAPRGNFNLAAYRAATRGDAVLLLRKGAEYFQKQEPNSPVPMLINRAIRISEMNFMELIADMMPDAVPRGRDILGVKPESGE